MGKVARIVVLTILLMGVRLGASSSAAPGSEPTAATLEVGTSPNCAYHTIADAIAAANPGDTIKVENTVFVESPLVISEDLTLAGGYNSAHPYSCLTLTGYNHTTVHRSGVTPAPILRIEAAQVTITWFILEDNANGSGLEVDNATLNLEDSIVRNNDSSGLLIYGGSNVALSRAEISGNSANAGGGLSIDGYSHVVADNTVIRENNGWDHGAGLSVQAGSTFTARNDTSIRHNRTVLGCDQGGGIYATGTDTQVLIDGSHVISNTALLQGGGLYLDNGARATIQNGSWIQENIAFGPASGAGGGVYVEGSDSALSVYNSILYSNWADPNGGGIWNESGTLDLDGAVLLANNAAQRGGGLYTSLGPATVRDSVFLSNVATYDSGGAIATDRAALSAHRSFFAGNTSHLEGSAIFVQGANGPAEPPAEIVNCFLVDNTTAAINVQGPPAGGSTLYVEGTSASIVHNTLAHDTPQASFGIYVGDGSDLALVNNIISGFYIGIRRVSMGTGTATSDHDLFYNNTSNYDTGITVVDPVLGDPAFVGGYNYHLTGASAAIDAGVDAGVAVDYDGDYRPWAGGFDIGADEFPDRVRIFLPSIRRGP
jgi:predicted outer membrane repeat protein